MNSPSDFETLELEMKARAAEFGDSMVTYWDYSRERFRHQLGLVGGLLDRFPGGAGGVRMLDVGPSFQTLLFYRVFAPRVAIDTFGFPDPKFPPPPGGVHVAYDLNDSIDPSRWPQARGYHLITMFEVIEHLYTSPVQVLRCLGSLLAPGGLILVSTPNAVALQSRLKMLAGRHPFEQIREDRGNPGHFREYTRRELCGMGTAAGLRVVEARTHNLASTGSWSSRVFRGISPFLPADLRKELSVIFQSGRVAGSEPGRS